ncbi:MAG: class I SAM-dependent methyltransferase [Flavobacteriales bacterium]
MTELGEWVNQHKNSPNSDFYSNKFDFSKRFDLYGQIADTELKDQPFTYLEFGVASGKSFRWWMEKIKHPQVDFHGFDTFTGLPEDWGLHKANSMSNDGKFPTLLDDRGKFHKGLFQETLPGFIRKNSWGKRLVIMMDADLYTSTLYVLTSLAPYMKPGDIILFDEFNIPRHEFLAFKNFVSSYYIKYEVIGARNNYYFVAVKLK